MKLRHAAALALVGRYLRVPLHETGSSKISVGDPLVNWIHLDTFDSAKECPKTGLRIQEHFKQDP